MSYIYRPGGYPPAVPLREDRAAILLLVRCSALGGAFFNIRVRNLSVHGLGGLCLQNAGVKENLPVTIAFRNVSPMEAHIMWKRGDEVGIRFDKPVDLATIVEARNWNGPGFEVPAQHRRV